MNINEKINNNYLNSAFVTLFKNRRYQENKGFIFDEIQHHHIRNDFFHHIINIANKKGYFTSWQTITYKQINQKQTP